MKHNVPLTVFLLGRLKYFHAGMLLRVTEMVAVTQLKSSLIYCKHLKQTSYQLQNQISKCYLYMENNSDEQSCDLFHTLSDRTCCVMDWDPPFLFISKTKPAAHTDRKFWFKRERQDMT